MQTVRTTTKEDAKMADVDWNSLPSSFYYDWSNMFVGAQLVNATTTDRDLSVRVNPRKMIPLIERGRTISARVVVGSTQGSASKTEHSVWGHFRSFGYEVLTQERVKGQKESFVDDAICARILREALLPKRNSNSTRAQERVLVLLTGDGNENQGSVSFVDAIQIWMEKAGPVELWTWKRCLSQVYVTLEKEQPTRFRVCLLDQHREHICFNQKRRGDAKQEESSGASDGSAHVPLYGQGAQFAQHLSPKSARQVQFAASTTSTTSTMSTVHPLERSFPHTPRSPTKSHVSARRHKPEYTQAPRPEECWSMGTAVIQNSPVSSARQSGFQGATYSLWNGPGFGHVLSTQMDQTD